MRPKSDSVIYRPDRGIMVMEYAEGNTMGFIGLEVMPIFPTKLNSGTFPVVPIEALLGAPSADRAPRGKYNRDDFEYERGMFLTVEKGVEEPVDDTERSLVENEANPGFADNIATQRAWGKIMRSQEKRIAAKVFNASNFTAHAVTNEWDDASNATPITDVETGKMAVRSACGLLPNTLIMAFSSYSNLKQCDQIINRLKYTFPGIDLNKITSQQLAMIFDVERVLIGGAVYNSAAKGKDASVADVWNHEYAMLTVTNNSMDISGPCIGRTFLWTEDSPQNPIVESYREEQIRSDVFRVRHHVDERLIQSINSSDAVKSNIAASCSYLFSNITT
jgi:hypothetical protein